MTATRQVASDAVASSPEACAATLFLLSKSGNTSRLSPRDREQLWTVCSPHVDFLRSRKLDGLLATASGHDTVLSPFYREVWQVQRRNLLQVIDAFAARSIDLIVYKGAEITEALFASRSIACRGDIDLMIRRGDIDRSKALMRELGFRQANFDLVNHCLVEADATAIRTHEENGYNLYTFARCEPVALAEAGRRIGRMWLRPLDIWETGAVCAAAIDISYGLDAQFASTSLFERSVESSFPGARTLSTTDMLWHICTLFYFGVFRQHTYKLTQLAELIALLTQRSLDWAELVEIAKKHKIGPGLFYVLSFVSRLVPGLVQEQALVDLDPVRGDRQRDWGWQIPKAFGFREHLPEEMFHGFASLVGMREAHPLDGLA